jgi:signal transduction histidine kinase
MRSNMRWTLRSQILIPFALVLIGAILTVSVVTAVLATQRSQRQIEEQLGSVAATLSDSSFPLTDAVLRQMRGLSGAEFNFSDLYGKQLAASSGLSFPDDLPVTADWHQLTLNSSVKIGDEKYFAMALQLNGRGTQPPGRLQIFYPERFWHEARNEAILSPLIVGAIALGVTGIVAVWLAGRLVRPMLEMRNQVNRIAEADYTPMTLPVRNDELRDLAESVNCLAQRLSEMERAIRRGERLALMGQLAGGLAHHLRNNVTGALMAVQLHARECDADAESLDVALRQLTLLEQHLKRYLAAPQASEVTLSTSKIDVHDLIADVVELLRPSMRHRRIELSASSTNDFGAASAGYGAYELRADEGQLRHLLINLILNGADAAGPGGRLSVESELARFDCESGEEKAESLAPHVVLRVIDSGPGPSADVAARLFEPFVTNKSEGIGLGLTVSQQIVQAHGGRIFFGRQNSETCFEVHLPMTQLAAKHLKTPAVATS